MPASSPRQPPATPGRRHSSASPAVRTCIGCRRRGSADDLVRVAQRGGELVVGRGPGRGAWLCRGSLGCVDEAARRRAFGRALRTELTSEAVGRLRAALQEHGKI